MKIYDEIVIDDHEPTLAMNEGAEIWCRDYGGGSIPLLLLALVLGSAKQATPPGHYVRLDDPTDPKTEWEWRLIDEHRSRSDLFDYYTPETEIVVMEQDLAMLLDQLEEVGSVLLEDPYDDFEDLGGGIQIGTVFWIAISRQRIVAGRYVQIEPNRWVRAQGECSSS